MEKNKEKVWKSFHNRGKILTVIISSNSLYGEVGISNQDKGNYEAVGTVFLSFILQAKTGLNNFYSVLPDVSELIFLCSAFQDFFAAKGKPLSIQFCFRLVGRFRSLPLVNPMPLIRLNAGRMFGHLSNGQQPQ